MQKVFKFANAEAVSDAMHDTSPLQSDRWGNWIKNNGSSGLVATISSSSKTSQPVSFGVQPPRKLEAPIEDKFQRQEEQIQQVCQDAQKEVTALRENMDRLERALETQKQLIDTNMESTANEFATLRAETGNQFQVMADLFKDSLKTAISSHDSAMSPQFEELKAMIASSANRNSPLAKKPETGNASDDPYHPR